MKLKKSRKKIIIGRIKIVALILVLFILIILISALFNRKSNPLVGKWSTYKGTIYQFNSDYSGKLIISTGEYEYKYEITGDRVFVDFVNDKSIDTEFTFKIEDDNLTLKSSNGTFKFKKIQ